MKFNKMTAMEYCDFVTDGTHDSPKAKESGRPLITSKHLNRYEIDFSTAKLISEKDYQKVIERSPVEQWDILFSMIGTIGNLYIETNENTEYACKNMGIFKMGGDSKKSKWLYYYLQSPKIREYISGVARGTTQGYVPLGALRSLPIEVPNDDIRDKITDILWSIDQKIKINIEINKNLSDVIQTIYQERFTSNLQGKLSDICTYSKERIPVDELTLDEYFSTENMLPNKAGVITATSLPSTAQTTKCHIGDVLISNIRPYFKKILYCHDEGGCSSDVLCFSPSSKKLSAFLYGVLYSDSFFDFMVAGSKGTKMPRGDKQQIMTYPIYMPTSDELDEYNAIAIPMLNDIYRNAKESLNLSSLRDTLLPRLISGEIDVSSIEI